jgi:regulator of sigma E protease
MELFFGIVLGLAILILLVIVHELGHAVIALRNGVVVEEFGVGFPPRAWMKKLKSGMVLSVNWLPLGGFVKLQGEHDAADKKGDYGSATMFQKTKILFAGVVANWIVAAILLTGMAFVGLPKVLPNQFTIPNDTSTVSKPVEITSLVKGFPAEEYGLKVGDEIVRFAGHEVPTSDSLIKLSRQNAGKTVEIIYNRKNIEHSVQVKLKDDTTEGVLGAGLGQRELIKSTWSAPIVGVATTAQFTWVTAQGLGDLIGNLFGGLVMQLSPDKVVRDQASDELKTVGDSVAGPIGSLGTVFPAAGQAGLTQLVFLTAIISVSLAVMNVLPIPALDGGRWFTMVFYRLMKKELTKEREEKIQQIGFSIIMGLVILVTFADVAKFF